MERLYELYVGDTWVNTKGTPIVIAKVNDSTVMIDSVEYVEQYSQSKKNILSQLNSGAYTDYKTIIPKEYVICTSAIRNKKTDMSVLNMARILSRNTTLTGEYISYINLGKGKEGYGGLKSNSVKTLLQWSNSLEIKYNKFLAIYNTIINLNDGRKDTSKTEETVQKERQSSNPCSEIILKESSGSIREFTYSFSGDCNADFSRRESSLEEILDEKDDDYAIPEGRCIRKVELSLEI